MSVERIMTLHPQGKVGVNIDREKYDIIASAIRGSLKRGKELTFTELMNAVGTKLENKFDGSIAWYVTTVNLDLEARGIVERLDEKKPHRLRLTKKS